jgi:dTDP-4-dehydrorhamnose 3,5-epimerase-like enzyme
MVNAKLIPLPSFSSELGSLTFAEEGNPLPFEPKRMYFLHGVPAGGQRGAHAHKALRQILIAVAGSFVVSLDDGRERSRYVLDNPERGLLLEPGFWREIHEFSPGAVCVVLASEKYDEQDYIRDYSEFKLWATTR